MTDFTDLVCIRDADDPSVVDAEMPEPGIPAARVVEINIHLDLARVLIDYAGLLDLDCTERRETMVDLSTVLGRVREWLAVWR
jgi:hypothetical protein